MNRSILLFCMGIVAYATSNLYAVNTVSVSTVSTPVSTSGVEIHIALTNDVLVRSLILPLVIRSQSGDAFITSAKGSFAERLPADPTEPLSDVVFVNHYHSEDGTCGPGGIGGFATIAHSDTFSHPVAAPPFAMMFTRARITASPALDPGADTLGSILMTFGINDHEGEITIDTTCTNPNNHILFVEYTPPFGQIPHVPDYNAGAVTVVACNCPYQSDFDADGFVTALDMTALIDVLFAGRADQKDALCPSTRGDGDCDGFATALDLSVTIDHLFAGGEGPCDPCSNLRH